MGIIFSLLLILLGILACGSLLEAKLPASVKVVATLRRYQETIGAIGLTIGVIGLIAWLLILTRFHIPAFTLVIFLVSAFINIALGFIFSFDSLCRQLKEPNSPALLKIESIRLKLLPIQVPLGIAAIVCAVLNLFS